MKTILKILLHLAGFPLLIALVVLESLPIIKSGSNYGIMVYVGIIFVVAMALIYYVVYLFMALRNKKTVYKQTIASVLVAIICLGGIWIAIDTLAPNPLKSATSNTLFYEDLADNYYARADVNKGLIDEYITINFRNGNLFEADEVDDFIITNFENGKLKKLTLKKYQDQGFKNKEVMKLLEKEKLQSFIDEGVKNEKIATMLTAHFESIHKDGYVTFVGPWLDMANDGRLTIPTLVHLIINKREVKGLPYPLGEEDDPVLWSILDMLGDAMVFDLGEDGMDVIPSHIAGMVSTFKYIITDVLNGLTRAIEDPDVVGSPIYITLKDSTVLTLTPSNESRGVLDYQSMGWLNSNGLIYLLISLFSIRKLCLIFAGVLVLTTYLIGLLRNDKQKANGKTKTNDTMEDNPEIAPIINKHQLELEMFKPYDPSYVVISQGDNVDFNKINQQLMYDAENKIHNRYDSKDFK